MAAPLRRLLAAQVGERRRGEDDALSRVPEGVFTHLTARPFILFWTIGRRSGLKRQKFWGVYEAWGDTIYSIEEQGTRADWVRNVLADPRVEIRERVGSPVLQATARVVADPAEEAFGRALVMKRGFIDVPIMYGGGTVIAFDAVL